MRCSSTKLIDCNKEIRGERRAGSVMQQERSGTIGGMSEERQPDDFGLTRPGWRYALWFGWNFLALAWFGVGILIAIIAEFAFAPWLGNGDRIHGAVAISVGVAVIVADLICRTVDQEAKGWTRYVSPFAGGAVICIPAWLVGIGIAATGIATVLGMA